MNEFDDLIGKARKSVKQAGLTKADIKQSVTKVRSGQ